MTGSFGRRTTRRWLVSETIKEFLIGLGFQTHGEKDFTTTIDNTTKQVLGLGVAAATAAIAMTAAVGVMANELEKLYFQSIRTGASAEGINAFGFSVARLGGSAEGASGSMEALASNMRKMPGYAGMIEGLGVSSQQSMEGIFSGLGTQFAHMPMEVGLAYAQALGIDERTFLAMREDTGEFNSWYVSAMKKLGYDTKAATTSAHGFMNELTKIKEVGSALVGRSGGILSEQMTPALARLENLFLSNASAVNAATDSAIHFATFGLEAVVRIGGRVVDIVKDVVEWYKGLDDNTKTIIESAALLYAGLKLVNAGWLAIAASASLVYDDYKTWKEGGAHLLPWDDWAEAMHRVGDAWKYISDQMKPVVDYLAEHKWLLGMLGGVAIGSKFGPYGMAAGAAAGAIAGGALDDDKEVQKRRRALEAPDALPNSPSAADLKKWAEDRKAGRSQNGGVEFHPRPGNKTDAILYFMLHGRSQANAIGITQGLWDESELKPDATNPHTQAYGVEQVLGDRKKRLFQEKNPENYETQLAFVNKEIDENYKGIKARLEDYTNDVWKSAHDFRYYFEVPSLDESTREAKSKMSANEAVKLENTFATEIHIYGNVDQSTLDQLTTLQGVNQRQSAENLVRTLKPGTVQ